MTTNEAFKKIVSDKEMLDRLGINQSTGRSLRKRFNEGKLSIEKIEAILTQAGAKVIIEKEWDF